MSATQTPQIDLLFLELSQFTRASTAKEVLLEAALCNLINAARVALELPILDAAQLAAQPLAPLARATEDARKVLHDYQIRQRLKGQG